MSLWHEVIQRAAAIREARLFEVGDLVMYVIPRYRDAANEPFGAARIGPVGRVVRIMALGNPCVDYGGGRLCYPDERYLKLISREVEV